jgi:hypothetical protein
VGRLAADCGLVDMGEGISANGLFHRYGGKEYDIMRTKLMQKAVK